MNVVLHHSTSAFGPDTIMLYQTTCSNLAKTRGASKIKCAQVDMGVWHRWHAMSYVSRNKWWWMC